MSKELQVHVLQKKPGTSERAAQLAEDYSCEGKETLGTNDCPSERNARGLLICYNCKQAGHVQAVCPKLKKPSGSNSVTAKPTGIAAHGGCTTAWCRLEQ